MARAVGTDITAVDGDVSRDGFAADSIFGVDDGVAVPYVVRGAEIVPVAVTAADARSVEGGLGEDIAAVEDDHRAVGHVSGSDTRTAIIGSVVGRCALGAIGRGLS